MEMLHEQIINLVIVLLTGLVGYLGKQIGEYFKKKGIVSQLESHKELVKLAVTGVEQAYAHLHGKEKLNMAKIEIIKLANARGIKISEKELDIVIEAVVKEMNDAVKAVSEKAPVEAK
jgi:N-acetylmuramoyl-L-alanine amidase